MALGTGVPGWALGAAAGSSILGGALGGLGGGQQMDVMNKPFWNNLFSGGNQLMGQQQQGLAGLMPLGGQLSQTGLGYQQTLGNAGMQMLPFLGQGATGQQIGALQGLLNQNLQQNLQGIQSGAGLAGQIGGGRQAVLQSQALGENQQALSMGVADILGRDIFRQQQAAETLGRQQLLGAGQGLQTLQQPYNAAFAPFQGQWLPFQQMAGLLGSQSPMGLGQSQGMLGGLGQGLQNSFNLGITI